MTTPICTSSRSLILNPVALVFLFLGMASIPWATAQDAPATSTAPLRSTDSAKAEPGNIPALFISDIHFDPFHDPALVKELFAAPADKWQSILSARSSSNQEEAFAALQQGCHAKGIDTPFILFHSSLQAMRVRQPNAKFMMVSGDLIAHAFACRFERLFPGAAPGDYEAFAVKTVAFVMDELRTTFPGVPVYVSLGNNDSGCGDYQLDARSEFLAQTGKVIAVGLPAAQQPEALKQFGEGGYYSVTMASPMRNTRLIVVNDLFLSPKYSTCGGKPATAAATEEMAWLERQLQDARQAGQRVWVMGHIPPGIDPFSTVAKFRDVCGGQAPVAFLSSDKMADLLVNYADVVRLGIFGHTHMDEMRLLEREGGEPEAAGSHGTAIKMISSISPVDGNNPSFTVGRVSPTSAMLEDYEVFAASNQTGIATTWATEYDFANTYHEPEFSSATVKKLTDEFRTDHGANTAASQAYIRDYFVGDMSRALNPFWPEYVCALDNHTAKGFAACLCSTTR
jgi:sphingomyelin phosphodiesterase acid-like 3